MRRSRLGISHATALLVLAGAAGCQVQGNGLGNLDSVLPGAGGPGTDASGPPKGPASSPDAGGTQVDGPPSTPPAPGNAPDAQVAPADAGPATTDTAPTSNPTADASGPADTAPAQPPPATACNRLPAGPFNVRQREESPTGDDITFDMDGHLLAFSGNDVVRLQGRNSEIVARNIVTPRGGGAMRVLTDGEIIVADFSRDRLVRIDPQSGLERLGMQIRSPMKMAVGASQRIYVTSREGVIYRIEPGRDTATVVAEMRARLGGATFSPDFRTLYVGATDERAIYAFPVDAQGNLGRSLLWSARVDEPAALATDECGNIYAGSDFGRLVRIDASGNVDILAELRAQEIWSLAFGSGKHGWSADAIYVLDSPRGVIFEIPVGVRGVPAPR